MKILGMCCFREGSKRLKNKNVKKIGGKPLYQYAIDTLELSPHIDDIAVYTDYNIKSKYLIERDALDTADTYPLWKAIKNCYEQNLKKFADFDAICHIMATNPLIKPSSISEAVFLMEEHGCEVVRSYDFFGRENGLLLFEVGRLYDKIEPEFTIDTYTGAITCEGEEIHTQKDFNYIRKLMNEGNS